MDKVAHHIKVQRIQKALLCRFSRVKQKGICLTEGELSSYELTGEQSAEVIVIAQTSLYQTQEDSRKQ